MTTSTSPPRIIDVADYVMSRLGNGRSLSSTKLTSLIFLYDGWSRALDGEALADAKWRIGALGPYGTLDLPENINPGHIPYGYRFGGDPSRLTKRNLQILDAVINDYGGEYEIDLGELCAEINFMSEMAHIRRTGKVLPYK